MELPKTGKPKTNKERLVSHYGEEKAKELLRLIGEDAYKLLPPRGTKVNAKKSFWSGIL